jgi:hypothetical protein
VFEDDEIDFENYFKAPVQSKREWLALVPELAVHLIDLPVLNLECELVDCCSKFDLWGFGELFFWQLGGVGL